VRISKTDYLGQNQPGSRWKGVSAIPEDDLDGKVMTCGLIFQDKDAIRILKEIMTHRAMGFPGLTYAFFLLMKSIMQLE
jgi:hypothetical protein